MNKSQHDDLLENITLLRQFSLDLLSSIKLLRWVGAGLLILALFDLIDILYPPQFMNPEWEFQTIGRLVERLPLPLIGLVLVFHGHHYLRAKWEQPILKGLSWIALVLGILCLLLIPLGIVDTVRLETQNNQRVSDAVNQRLSQTKEIKTQLQQAQTIGEMEQLLKRLNQQKLAANLTEPQGLLQVKTQLDNSIVSTEANIVKQGAATRLQQNHVLFKNSLKWNLGALVGGVLFVNIWRCTQWARFNKI